MPKPDLLKVLRHYGIDVTDGRVEQLILCPVHSESKPSCSVNADKGLWNCKACAAQGDSLTLIQMREGLKDFGSVVEFAEKVFGSVSGVPAGPGRVGLSGKPRPARGGFRPAFRKRPGLTREA